MRFEKTLPQAAGASRQKRQFSMRRVGHFTDTLFSSVFYLTPIDSCQTAKLFVMWHADEAVQYDAYYHWHLVSRIRLMTSANNKSNELQPFNQMLNMGILIEWTAELINCNYQTLSLSLRLTVVCYYLSSMSSLEWDK